jgi:hypothetical protein
MVLRAGDRGQGTVNAAQNVLVYYSFLMNLGGEGGRDLQLIKLHDRSGVEYVRDHVTIISHVYTVAFYRSDL